MTLLSLLGALGCGWSGDADGDGYWAGDGRYGDCDDRDAAVHPLADDSSTDGVDQDCDGVDGPDLDGDSFAGTGDDCDDLDPAVHPGVQETWYDGVDSDCDGAEDDDQDGDGHPADFAGGDDCDDTHAAVHPGADETWYDGIDGDCDGSSDWDQDGDGADIVPVGGDCDDEDAAIGPSAEELPGAVDENCDGFLGTASRTTGDGDPFVYGVFDHQMAGVGAAVAGGLDLSGDGQPDLVVSDPGASEEHYLGGLVAVLTTPPTLATRADQAPILLHPVENEEILGVRLAIAPDLSGDGKADLVVGSPYAHGGDGRASVWWGPLPASATSEEADCQLTGAPDQAVGSAVASVGDVTGDGVGDAAIGAIGGFGAVAILSSECNSVLAFDDAGIVLRSEAEDRFGASVVGPGDVDGDGLDDLVVSAPASDEAQGRGRVDLFYGPVGDGLGPGEADHGWYGEVEPTFGDAMAALGDMDGDGHPELAVGAWTADGGGGAASGVVYVFDLTSAGSTANSATATLDGVDPNARAGAALAAPGDLDGDGFADLVVGAPGTIDWEAGISGAAYLVYGPITGAGTLDEADFRYADVVDGGGLGSALATVGDLDGDELPELFVGAPESSRWATSAGVAWLLAGARWVR